MNSNIGNQNCNKSNTQKSCNNSGQDCYNLKSLEGILRSPKIFHPEQALSNLDILARGYTGVKAGILNFLYQVSELYDQVNKTVDVHDIELNHLENMYKDSVNEMLSAFTTSFSSRMSDCSFMVSFDLYWQNDTQEFDADPNDLHNKNKIEIDDLPRLQYKNFDVAWPNSTITTYFDRPSFQILADRSSYGIVLRTLTDSKWTPVARDSYGISGNKLYSQRNSTATCTTKKFVLAPSTELRKKGTDLDYRIEPFGTGIDLSGNQVNESFGAFASRRNCQIFFESILTPVLQKPEVNTFDIAENDIVVFLGFLDQYIRQTELVKNSIMSKICINNSVGNNDNY